MPPKKQTETAPESVAEKVTTPDKVSVEITDSIGLKDHRYVTNDAVVVGKNDLKDVVEIRQTVKTIKLLQPILSIEEAELLGHQKWNEWPHIPNHFTTGVNGRRFIVSKTVLGQLKEKGLVL